MRTPLSLYGPDQNSLFYMSSLSVKKSVHAHTPIAAALLQADGLFSMRPYRDYMIP
jgi:hypothetical protein